MATGDPLRISRSFLWPAPGHGVALPQQQPTLPIRGNRFLIVRRQQVQQAGWGFAPVVGQAEVLVLALAGIALVATRSPRLGILLMALGIARCGGSTGGTTNNACANVDCDEHGQCLINGQGAALCLCDDGYQNSESTHCTSAPTSDAGVPDSASPPPDAISNSCTPRCESLQHAVGCRTPAPGEELFITEFEFDCPENTVCQDGGCVTVPGNTDTNCPTTTPISSCRVTDLFDLSATGYFKVPPYYYEDDPGYSDILSYYSAICGEDGGYRFSQHFHTAYDAPGKVDCSDDARGYENYFAHTLAVDPPSDASYYRFDLKASWGAESCPGESVTQGVRILFGDDQRFDFYPSDSLTTCIFEPIAYFTTAGISSSRVRINLDRTTDGQNTYLDVAKTRIWSCSCGS